jgi:hypothetical protein
MASTSFVECADEYRELLMELLEMEEGYMEDKWRERGLEDGTAWTEGQRMDDGGGMDGRIWRDERRNRGTEDG